MAINAGDVLRVVLTYELPDLQVNTNVFHYLAGSGVSDTDANVVSAISSNLDTAYTDLEASLDAIIAPGEVIYSKRDPITGKWEQFAVDSGTAPNGGAAGDPTPNVAAAVVRFHSDGIGQQGRKFLSGFNEQLITENIMQAGLVSALVSYGADINNTVAVAGGNMIPGWWSEVDTIHRAYSQVLSVSNVIGTMVTRKPGRGI